VFMPAVWCARSSALGWFRSSARATVFCALIVVGTVRATGQTGPSPNNRQQVPASASSLRGLTLEQLSNVEVVTYDKTPTDLMKTPAAIYVITNEDIQRSGVTSIADALRLAPGVEVARISSTTWAIGI
jgi:outer membrane receptor protein involved in Fe transport